MMNILNSSMLPLSIYILDEGQASLEVMWPYFQTML